MFLKYTCYMLTVEVVSPGKLCEYIVASLATGALPFLVLHRRCRQVNVMRGYFFSIRLT